MTSKLGNQNRFAALAIVVMALILAALPAQARPVSDDTIATPQGKIKAGITPSSPLHFFEKFFDNLGMAFTASKEKKAEKSLNLAREHLLEAKEELDNGNINAARIAQKEHASALLDVEGFISKISDDDIRLKLEKEIEFENELGEHQIEVEIIKELVRNSVGAGFDDSRLSSADDVMAKFEAAADSAKSRIELERSNSALELKIETGKSDSEIELEIRQMEDRLSRSTGERMAEVEIGSGRSRSSENELRGRELELGEDIRGNADENELRGRDNELGEDIRGNADEAELRGRENEPGEDIRGNADENEVRGREAEGEAPRGADSPSDFDSTPNSRGGSGSSSGGSSDD